MPSFLARLFNLRRQPALPKMTPVMAMHMHRQAVDGVIGPLLRAAESLPPDNEGRYFSVEYKEDNWGTFGDRDHQWLDIYILYTDDAARAENAHDLGRARCRVTAWAPREKQPEIHWQLTPPGVNLIITTSYDTAQIAAALRKELLSLARHREGELQQALYKSGNTHRRLQGMAQKI